MRSVMAAMASAALVLVMAASTSAATMTVKGKVVDEGCSMASMKDHGGGKPESSAEMDECALQCAKNGEPLALLTDDGKVYRITGGLAANKNAKLIAHMNHTVEITGEVGQQDGKTTIAADALKMVAK